MILDLMGLLVQAESVPPDIVNRALEINPYNGIAYGALVLVLGYIAWKADNERKKKDQQLVDLAKSTVELMTKVEEKMPGMAQLSDVKVLMESLKRDHGEILKAIKEQSSKEK